MSYLLFLVYQSQTQSSDKQSYFFQIPSVTLKSKQMANYDE